MLHEVRPYMELQSEEDCQSSLASILQWKSCLAIGLKLFPALWKFGSDVFWQIWSWQKLGVWMIVRWTGVFMQLNTVVEVDFLKAD